MKHALLKKIGVYLFALPMVYFGSMHLAYAPSMESMMPAYFPAKVLFIYLTGALLIITGASLILQKNIKITCQLLGLMFMIFVLLIHLPSVIGGNPMSLPNILKDSALAGAAFIFSANSQE